MDELELADGDEVLVLEVVEEGWWKGRVGQKEGVFPSNFVEEIRGSTRAATTLIIIIT